MDSRKGPQYRSSNQDVRIVLVGDSGVGKSTLIMSLVREQFVPEVPSRIEEVVIPPEVTPEHVTTYVIDTNNAAEERALLEEQVRNASVICIVYAVDSPASFRNISQYWIPTIRSIINGDRTPLILVGNKTDMRSHDEKTDVSAQLVAQMKPLMAQCRAIETCVECSARSLRHLSEVFYFAQKAVLHPTSPLYDAKTHQLKRECKNALTRIFHLCDTDKDGLINDRELNEFQRKCFNQPLSAAELTGVKQMVQNNNSEGIVSLSSVRAPSPHSTSPHLTPTPTPTTPTTHAASASSGDDSASTGLSLSGFLTLHMMFIQNGRIETTWQALRAFGYANNLQLRPDFLFPPLNFDTVHTSTELGATAVMFLSDLFGTFDRDNDSALSSDDMARLMETCPIVPWDCDPRACTEVTERKLIKLEGFLSLWAMAARIQPRLVITALIYLGYRPAAASKAIKVLRGRKGKNGDFQRRRTARRVFVARVFGGRGAGKSTVVRSLVQKTYHGSVLYQHQLPPQCAVCELNMGDVAGHEMVFVMRESGTADGEDALRLRAATKSKTSEADDGKDTGGGASGSSSSGGGGGGAAATSGGGGVTGGKGGGSTGGSGVDSETEGGETRLRFHDDGSECDLIVWVFDVTDSHSFAYIADRLPGVIEADPTLPCAIVATHCDVPFENWATQESVDPEEFCKAHNLPPVLYFDVNGDGNTQKSSQRRAKEATVPTVAPTAAAAAAAENVVEEAVQQTTAPLPPPLVTPRKMRSTLLSYAVSPHIHAPAGGASATQATGARTATVLAVVSTVAVVAAVAALVYLRTKK